MSLQNHLVELERRHRALEKEIESTKLHDPARVAELKRKKLLLKDEIAKLRAQNTLH